MNKNKVLPYIIFGVPALIAVYLIYRSLRGKGKDAPVTLPKEDDAKTEPSGNTGIKPTVAKYFPLQKGSKGAKVTELQEALLALGKDLGTRGTDGDFGSKTEGALVSVTGKTSVSNQQELDDIKAKKKTADKEKEISDSRKRRIVLANKLLDALSLNKNLDFYAINPTAFTQSTVTSDGREYGAKNVVFKIGDKIDTGGYTKELVTNDGFIKLYRGNQVFLFSPYAFELK